jgi:hypothetical protein
LPFVSPAAFSREKAIESLRIVMGRATSSSRVHAENALRQRRTAAAAPKDRAAAARSRKARANVLAEEAAANAIVLAG